MTLLGDFLRINDTEVERKIYRVETSTMLFSLNELRCYSPGWKGGTLLTLLVTDVRSS